MFQGHPDQYFGHLTYSQHGEDLMLANIFRLMKIENPSYLDIGAHHPTAISNTALLYSRGSRGVNIEANPFLIEAFRIERPEDQNICIGIGLKSGSTPFYMFDPFSGLNTLNLEDAEAYSKLSGRKFEVTHVDAITLTEAVYQYCSGLYPDLLSLDIEGLDYDVLNQTEFLSSQPKVICVETRRSETAQMRSLLLAKGYGLLCRMGMNLIFIDERRMSEVY